MAFRAKTVAVLFAAAALTAAAPVPPVQTFTGIVTETMCKLEHTMGVKNDAECVRQCVGDGKTYKYALAVGKKLYTLSDQETPAKFAAQKVKVTGVLYTRTNIIKVEAIAPAR